jgi:hypothetical protein
MSSANLYQMDFSFTTLPLRAWIKVIIRAANNLLSFILTIGFGEEYNFLNFHCEYPSLFLCKCPEGRNDSPKDL